MSKPTSIDVSESFAAVRIPASAQHKARANQLDGIISLPLGRVESSVTRAALKLPNVGAAMRAKVIDTTANLVDVHQLMAAFSLIFGCRSFCAFGRPLGVALHLTDGGEGWWRAAKPEPASQEIERQRQQQPINHRRGSRS